MAVTWSPHILTFCFQFILGLLPILRIFLAIVSLSLIQVDIWLLYLISGEQQPSYGITHLVKDSVSVVGMEGVGGTRIENSTADGINLLSSPGLLSLDPQPNLGNALFSSVSY